MTMAVIEAIKTALVYENKVRDVYIEAFDSSDNPEGKRVMKILAEEEQGHINYLEHNLHQWQETGKISTDSIDTVIPSPQKISDEIEKLKTFIRAKDRNVVNQDTELRMLEKALEVEKETSNFYQQMVNAMDGDLQIMFSRFLEIERGHLAIIEAEINSVSGLGYWFNFQEFKVESE
jgi:rubrerythrin